MWTPLVWENMDNAIIIAKDRYIILYMIIYGQFMP